MNSTASADNIKPISRVPILIPVRPHPARDRFSQPQRKIHNDAQRGTDRHQRQ